MHKIGWIRLADGTTRDVFRDADARQFVLDEDGNRVHGTWLVDGVQDETANRSAGQSIKADAQHFVLDDNGKRVDGTRLVDEVQDDAASRSTDQSIELAANRGNLIMLLGLLSLIGPWLCIPIFFAPVALWIGIADLRKIRTGRIDSSGKWKIVVGMISGIITTIFTMFAGWWVLAWMTRGGGGKF